MRLFLACPIPAPISEQLLMWAARSFSFCPGVRLSSPDTYHVTVSFFGEVTAEQKEEIASLVKGAPWPRLDVWIEHAEFYKRAIAAQVWLNEQLWMDLDSLYTPFYPPYRSDWMGFTSTEWHQIYKFLPENEKLKMSRSHRRGGTHLDPHVTVARLARQATQPLIPPLGRMDFVLPRPRLYVSHLEPEGARYEVVDGSA